MKTYISDIIPKIQRYSQKLDNLTLLTNQHWVVIDDIISTKLVYIFRQNSELLISKNGRVIKAKWEYLGNNSLLIDNENESYLFKHGFFDENILALKIDSKDEYAFLVNETKYDNELNSVSNVIDFLNTKYIEGSIKKDIKDVSKISNNKGNESFLHSPKKWVIYMCQEGKLEVEIFEINKFPWNGDKAKLNGKSAPNGKYKISFMQYVHIKDGIVIKTTFK